MKKIIFVILIFLVGSLIATALFLNNTPPESVDDNKELEPKERRADSKDKSSDPDYYAREDKSPVKNGRMDPVIPDNKAPKLGERPENIRAIYFTSGSAGREEKIEYLINIVETTPINAVVLDINNFGGALAYDSSLDFINDYGIDTAHISNMKSLVSRLHDHDIYVIARIVMFQDSILARARPDLAVQRTSTSTVELWKDSGGQLWLDPASREVWARKMYVAGEVSSMGFDELNFDYIRFPSDGDLENTKYPFWDPNSKTKGEVLAELFEFMRNSLPNDRISIDVFGLTTVNRGGLGIGQILEETMRYFDVIAPMVYPSHYDDGSFGIEKPAEKPYEIVLVSLTNALIRMNELKKVNPDLSVKIRPWLQDFDLGADYDAEKVRVQIEATKDSLRENYSGYMLWNPRNIYTIEAFRPSIE